MKIYKSLLINLIMVILSSCGSTNNLAGPSSIPAPDIGIEIQNDKSLEVSAPAGWNSFKADEPISLLIRNISEKQIVSSQDFGARIFARTRDKWIEVQNKAVYENDPITLEPDKGFDPTKIVSVFVFPDLPDYSVTTYIRIFVVGTLIENNKESRKIASYIDLKLSP